MAFGRQTVFTRAILALAFLLPLVLAAQDYVVPPAQFHQDVAAAGKARQANLEKLRGFLSTPQAQRTFNAAHVDSGLITRGVAQLSDAELALLAARASQAQADFAAGALTNQEITYILIALATAVIVLILVH